MAITLPKYGEGGKITLPPFQAFQPNSTSTPSASIPAPVPQVSPYKNPALSALPGLKATGAADALRTTNTPTNVFAPIEHPVATLGGVVKGTMDVFFDALKGGASLVGAHNFSKYVADNQDAVNQIFESNMQSKDAHTAGVVGQFAGQQVPYILAGSGLSGLAEKLVPGIVAKVGGGLTLSKVAKVGAVSRIVANVAGFTAVNQLTMDPKSSTDQRLAQLRNDVLVLGVLEGLGAGAKTYGDAKLKARAKGFMSDLQTGMSVDEMAAEANSLKAKIEVSTGKTPQKLLETQYPKLLTSGKVNEIAPREEIVTKVPGSQLPVGTGLEKVSTLEARVKGLLDAAPEDVKGLSTYSAMNDKKQIASAVKYVQENGYENAISILKGEKPAPKGLLTNSIYVALTQDAETNTDLATKLASLRSTRLGQEIQILSQVDKLNPVKYMTDLVDSKIEALGGREKVAALRDAEMGTVKRAISVSRLTKTDWNSFIDSITC